MLPLRFATCQKDHCAGLPASLSGKNDAKQTNRSTYIFSRIELSETSLLNSFFVVVIIITSFFKRRHCDAVHGRTYNCFNRSSNVPEPSTVVSGSASHAPPPSRPKRRHCSSAFRLSTFAVSCHAHVLADALTPRCFARRSRYVSSDVHACCGERRTSASCGKHTMWMATNEPSLTAASGAVRCAASRAASASATDSWMCRHQL